MSKWHDDTLLDLLPDTRLASLGPARHVSRRRQQLGASCHSTANRAQAENATQARNPIDSLDVSAPQSVHVAMDHNAPSPTFKIGDLVVARTSDQGLTAGEYYTVVDWTFNAMEFGVYVAYVLQPAGDGEQLTVRNLHLLVEHTE